MPNKNYLAGRRFEYDTMKTMKAAGYSCIRASGSHGEYDIVCYRPERKPLMIQCKIVSTEAQAQKLCKDFKYTTLQSSYYHQVMMARVKGSKTLWRQEV